MAVLYDNTFATERIVNSIVPGGPFEITGIPFNAFGTGTLELTATVEAYCGTINDDDVLTIYVYDPGHAADGAFISFAVASLTASHVASVGVYTGTFTMTDGPGGPSFVDFTGTGTAQSVYVYPPVVFPNFNGSTFHYRNLHITITGTAPVPVESATTVYDAVAAAQFGTALRQNPKV